MRNLSRHAILAGIGGALLALSLAAVSALTCSGDALASPSSGPTDPVPRARVRSMLDNLPLAFIENRGQEDPRVSYSLPGRDTTVYFTPGGVTFALTEPPRDDQRRGLTRLSAPKSEPVPRQRWAVKLDFVDANPGVVPRGQDLTPATVSYFRGPASQWKAGLRTYSSVLYADLWPGVDMVYSGTSGRMKSTFSIKPGADPARIQLAYRGATAVKLTDDGQLEVSTPVGGFADDRPYAYQETGVGRKAIPAAYVLAADSRAYSFKVGDYDRNRTLVLDPSFLVYAGYVGGSTQDQANAIAVDSAGNAYVAGTTASTVPSFPGTVGPDLTYNGSTDAFVAKIKADGTGLVYAGYIGGSQLDRANGIAVDSAGNAYVTGETGSDEASFPVKIGPGLVHGGSLDAFVAKVKADGTGLVYAGYIGGAHRDRATGIDIDSGGNAYVAGETNSDETTFPVKVGPGLAYSGGAEDAFVAKVKADGTGLVYAGYIGGADQDQANGLAVDSAGAAYVVGQTISDQTTFPVRVGPQLAFNGGIFDGFVAKVRADGTALVYAGYIGGAGNSDAASGIAVDSAGNAYVTGRTDSDQTTFPVRVGPDLTFNGSTDAFVAKVKPDGTGFVYAGYIGGTGSDEARAIAVDSAGSAYVAGGSSSTSGFPIRVGPGLINNGQEDIFVAKVRADGTGLLYSGFIGGVQPDFAFGIAVDSGGNAYVAGITGSDQTTFPVVVGPDLLHNGDFDAFVLKVSGKPNLLEGALTNPSVAKRGGSFAVSSTAINQGLGTAPASTTRYYLSPDDARSNGDILLTGSKSLGSLVPGATAGGGATVTVPAATPLGSYFVLACADDTRIIAELDENDNCGPSSGMITVTLPDLREITLSQPPPSANPGNQFSVTDFVQNSGAVGSGGSTTRYYVSTDSVKSADDVRLTGSRAVGALNPNGTTGSISGGTVTVTIPSTTPLGVYRLIACADDLSAVPETIETNNCLTSSQTMNLSAPAFDPAVALKFSGRVATVVVLATCTDGAEIHLTVSVSQGDAFGEGNATGKCTGNPGRYAVSVPAQGPAGFAPGPAEIHGEAVVKLRGEVLDDHFWTRTLNLAF